MHTHTARMNTHRAMEFMFIFLEEVLSGEEDLVKCANKAYNDSLRRYHGWIVRGIFQVSIRLDSEGYRGVSSMCKLMDPF